MNKIDSDYLYKQDHPMNPEVKKLWVEALRSGIYKETASALKIHGIPEPKYCCLGVLCDIYIKQTGEGKWIENAVGYTMYDGFYYRDGSLPKAVCDWANLEDDYVSGITIEGETHYLSTHNDGGVSFLKLADAIEQQL